jgi:hypothetical protein
MKLTRAQRRVLKSLAENEDIDLAFDKGGGWWIGDEQTNGKLATALIRMVLVRKDGHTSGDMERYTINDSGRRALEGLPPYRASDGRYYDTFYECMATLYDAETAPQEEQ